jgi:hypothetical protein
MTRTQITNCVDCPLAYHKDKIRIWERYNWTTRKTEETRTFSWNNTDDLKDISEIHELALEWLQDPENLCNQDGEWTETGYVYFRGGQTIEIRETYYGPGVTCTIDGNPRDPYDDAKYCDVAADENRIPTYERYNSTTKTTEQTVDIDEDDDVALETAVDILTRDGDGFDEEEAYYNGMGYQPDASSFPAALFPAYKTRNAAGDIIIIQRVE